MRLSSFFLPVWLLAAAAVTIFAADPKSPQLGDPELRLEAVATYPEIEAPTTVSSAPDGSFYVGCDPRDTRLNTEKPECSIVRFSGTGANRKRTVFADKLYSPAGSLWLAGWLYVTHDPFLSRFRDQDGDGVAEQREDLISKLGVLPQTGLNDHCVSGMTLGMDGFIYLSVGDRGIYRAVGKDGSSITMQGGGVVRCRPDGTALEVFSRGTRNHLSVLLDAEDNIFTRDNTDDGNGWWTRLTHHIQGGFYGYPFAYQSAPHFGILQPSAQTLAAVQQHAKPALPSRSGEVLPTFLPAMTDFGSGSPTGGVCYLSDGLPEAYRGRLLCAEWGKGALFAVEVVRDGASFRFVKETPLVQGGKGVDFRPLEVSVASDGSVLVADWGWGGWKAPKKEGVIWRLSWPAAKIAPRLADESQATQEALLAALGHPDRKQRLEAEVAIRARVEALARKPAGQDAATAIVAAVQGIAEAPAAASVARWHALGLLGWLQNLDFEGAAGQPDFTFPFRRQIAEIFAHTAADRDPSIREHALRAMNSFEIGRPNRSSLAAYRNNAFLSLLHDPEARVRLAAAQIVERTSAPRADPEALMALIEPLEDADAWVQSVATRAVSAILQNMQDCCGQLDESSFYAAKLLRDPQPALRERAWRALEMDALWGNLPMLTDFLASEDADLRARAVSAYAGVAYQARPYDGQWWGTQPAKNAPPLPNLAWEGTAQVIEVLTGVLADPDPSIRLVAAKGFGRFLMDRAASSSAPALAALRARLLPETDAAVRQQLMASLGVQKDPEAAQVFSQIALDDKADAKFRATALQAIVNIGGETAQQTIARLASAPRSPAIRRQALTAAGTLQVAAAAPALIAELRDGTPGDRITAVQALAEIGPRARATEALATALTDPDLKVQTAVVTALGRLRDPAAIPALLEFWEKKRARKELLNALAAMPDLRSLPVLVSGLAENSPSTRRNVLLALSRLGEEALPLIEQKLASGEIPADFAPEIRANFDRGVITRWRVTGPFENVWASEHGPEADARAQVELFQRRYVNAANQETGWREVEGDNEDGRVDLGKTFDTRGMVCAYASLEIQATEAGATQLFGASDDQIAIWLNGQLVHNRGGTRAFLADQDQVPVQFRKGRNVLLVKSGNVEGSWQFAVRVAGLHGGKFTPKKDAPPDVKQREFALALRPDGSWEHAGDPSRGERIFHEATGPLGGLCATCHAARGKGGQIGPDLSGVGVNYRRPELIASILTPSQTIALGYEQVLVQTKSGETVSGALRQETDESLRLVGADGQPHVVPKADVASRQALPTSLMPPGITLSLKVEEFTDLLAYLESLRGQ